jgi:hypothetical protein
MTEFCIQKVFGCVYYDEEQMTRLCIQELWAFSRMVPTMQDRPPHFQVMVR